MKIVLKTLVLAFVASTIFFSCKKNHDNNQETLNPQDRSFITQAALTNKEEIQAGQLADSTADSSAIKAFAATLVNDHQAAESDLVSLGSQVNVNVPDSVDSSHMMMMDSLRGMTGRAFDSAFIMQQIQDHNAAISQYQTEISAGNKTAVISYANKYLPKLQMHLATADSIAAAMGFK